MLAQPAEPGMLPVRSGGSTSNTHPVSAGRSLADPSPRLAWGSCRYIFSEGFKWMPTTVAPRRAIKPT